MLSEPSFLITTPVYDYPVQLQAVTGTVAVLISACKLNETCFLQRCIESTHGKSLVHIKINTVGHCTPDDPGPFIRQNYGGFQEPSLGLEPSPPQSQASSSFSHSASPIARNG